MKRSLALLLFLFVFLSFPKYASAATYYVSRNGNNSTGTSWSNAWNELNQISWSSITAGDTIYIDGGTDSMTYVTQLTPTKSGTSTSPIRILASQDSGHSGKIIINGGRKAMLPECGQLNYDPYGSASQVFQNEAGIFLENVSNIIIDGGKWNGILITRNAYGIRFRPNTSYITVRNVEIFDNGRIYQKNDDSVSNLWYSDGPGVRIEGHHHTFERMNIHDNGADGFQSGNSTDFANNALDYLTIRESWIHNTRAHSNKDNSPSGDAPDELGSPTKGPAYNGFAESFNWCKHSDSVQIYIGGDVTGFKFEDSIFGPGFTNTFMLGDTITDNLTGLSNFTITNSLILKGADNNINSKAGTPSKNWTFRNITVHSPNTKSNGIRLQGTGHVITDSVFYDANSYMQYSLSTNSGNCQYMMTGNIFGTFKVDPMFASASSSPFSDDNYAVSPSSACYGKGSRITSVAHLLNIVNGGSSSTPAPTAVPTPVPTPTIPPIATPTPSVNVFMIEDFEDSVADSFAVESGTWNIVTDGTKVYDSLSTDPLARTVVGKNSNWTNYVVETKVKANTWGSTTNRTSGFVTRYKDASNYYIIVFEDGQLRIRKKVAGGITTLAAKTFTMNTGQWYTFKAVMNGSTIEFHVNGVKQLSAIDSSLATGGYGLVSVYGDIHYDDFSANNYSPTTAPTPTIAPTVVPTPTAVPTILPTVTPISTPTPNTSEVIYSEDFEDSVADGWSQQSGTWTIVTDGTKVYDSDSSGRLSRAVVGMNNNWNNYTVESRVKVNSWGHPSYRTAGLITRYRDINNYYYFVYESGQLRIRKKVNGELTTMAAKSFTFNTNTWYTFKAVANGTILELYVNGVKQLAANDTSLSSGGAGLISVYGDSRFDNFTVSSSTASAQSPTQTQAPVSSTLNSEDFEDSTANGWTTETGVWNVITDGTKVYQATSDENMARAVVGKGSGWANYTVESKLKINNWGSTTYRTAGLLMRYKDIDNYYYLVFELGQLKIRKKLGGQLTTLASKTFNPTLGSWYTLKGVVNGSTVELYINGVKELSATDTSHTSGAAGIISVFGDSRFDDFKVTQ